ncbi:MAG: histidine phosphatase family protein [Desulfuromonadales bacterium]|nr:histidine phosphatase family protein [Desulfuromonadales bacterium]
MKLHIIRHAQAIARATEIPDEQRTLSCRGRRRFRQVAATLKKLEIDPDLIITSPKARALQTAEILAETISFSGDVQIAPILGELCTATDLLQILPSLPSSDEIIIVGHEPDLGAIIAELLTISVPCRLARGSSVTIKLSEKNDHLSAELMQVVTGTGKVLTGRHKTQERLLQTPLREEKS